MAGISHDIRGTSGPVGMVTDSESTLDEPNLSLGLMAVRNEFVNLSELKHCLEVRRKIFGKSKQVLNLGEVLVQQRYLTPQDLEYLQMILEAEPPGPVEMTEIEAEFGKQLAELKPGSEFSEYKIEEEIGRGGMGIVLRALTPDDDEERALKILLGGKDASVRDIERFKKEATVMAPLIHSGIVRIHEVGRHRGLDFIAMEFIEGVSLKELVGEKKPLDSDLALHVIRDSAEAVGFMHSHGIIHRDIKPENIMTRPDGSAVLMDFGLAGWDKIEILAGRGSIGTPMYQPPEQADVGGPFGKITEASDVYGLGATLYFLLTGRHPFLGRSVKEVRDKIKTKPPDPIRQINAKVHPAVEALCLRCLKKRQSERFNTPKELVQNINKVLDLLADEGGSNPKVRLMRRIAAATRRKSEMGRKSDVAKTTKPGKAKGPRPRSPSGRGGVGKSGTGKISKGKSATGKVLGSRRAGAKPKRAVPSDAGQTEREGPAPLVIVAIVAALLGVILGAILLLTSGG